MKTIQHNGSTHQFPDDATEEEISAVLGPSASQRDVRQIDNAIEEKGAFVKGLKGLKTSQKKMYTSLFIPAHEQLQQERDELTLSNFMELEEEIKRTKDPKAKQILIEEHGRMKNSYANILGIK